MIKIIDVDLILIYLCSIPKSYKPTLNHHGVYQRNRL